jgi:membrane protein YdbS with pleckstrin-like domain
MTAVVPSDLQPVEPGYRGALMLQAAIFFIPILIGASVIYRFVLYDFSFAPLLPLAAFLLAFSSVVYAPRRIYNRLGYALDEKLLRVVRGWLFHTDTIVPFVRVQHIDVTSGPVDKIFGLASLVVHTAGTHNSVVTLPGLAPARAREIRDAIRAEIRADAE